MCMYFYIGFIQIYCVNVCVCLRNGLSSHKCCNYLHARLSSISICRDCSKSLRHKHTLYVYTHLHLHTHAYTFPYTHISHTHTCPASPWLVFRLSILHMHLCWHYYNTRPTLPPYPPLFSQCFPRQICNFALKLQALAKVCRVACNGSGSGSGNGNGNFYFVRQSAKAKIAKQKLSPSLYFSPSRSLIFLFAFPFCQPIKHWQIIKNFRRALG